jgi:hypothetical protein
MAHRVDSLPGQNSIQRSDSTQQRSWVHDGLLFRTMSLSVTYARAKADGRVPNPDLKKRGAKQAFIYRSPQSVLIWHERVGGGAFPLRILVSDHRDHRRNRDQRP